ncbi:MAG: tetratricopeptide repeat protein [Anaerolineae bacterium]|nr:tetratricopeptide repeat protein [Gloeobacterales cyanobacterium ES-bin-313]
MTEAIALASRHVQARNFQEAATIYQKILQTHPDHPVALHDFGVLFQLSGQPLKAAQLLNKACLINPDWFEAHRNLAITLAFLGRPAESAACCRHAITLNPSDFQMQFLLGKQLILLGQFSEAEEQLQSVISVAPDFLSGHLALGEMLVQQGKGKDAIDFYRKLLDTYPDHFSVYSGLAYAMEQEGRQEEAVQYYRQAFLKLSGSDSTDQMITVHNNLGGVLKDLGRLEEAAWEHQQSIRLNPENPQSHASLAVVLLHQGALDEAALVLQNALHFQPDHAYARVALSWLQLLRENFQEGLANFEWRIHGDYAKKLNKFPHPFWDGSSLEGKTILIVPDGGYGDTFQFIRYASLLQQQGARVIVVCSPLLEKLLATCPGVDMLVTSRKDLPPIDVQVLLQSLPHRFGTLADTIPADMPYLWAPPTCHLPESLRTALTRKDTFKVGIVWSPSFQPLKILEEVKRYCSLEHFEALLIRQDIQWFSLYKGERSHELLVHSGQVIDVGSSANDFSDTAWAIDRLDLVISVDTSVAHLAGAMGKPIWVLLPTMPEWRWMLEREDSPWYPTMRLFRQQKAGDWSNVLEQVGKALDALIACRTNT